MKPRKIFSVIIAALIIFSMGILSSCASQQAEEPEESMQQTEETATPKETQEEQTAVEETVDPYGKYEEPITLTTIFASNSAIDEMVAGLEGETIEDNRWTRVIKDELNIDIEYTAIVDASQFSEKLNIMIASGQIPDFVPGIDASTTKQMYDAGLIMPVRSLFDKWASDVNQTLHNVNRYINWTAFEFGDGEAAAIPNVGEGDTLDNAKMLWIRRDWLENLGMEAPENAQELDELIRAFAEDDPDGDGEDDTLGMGVLGGNDLIGTTLSSLAGYFNTNQAHPSIFIEQDGKLVSGLATQEVKDTLTKLQDMYAKGYIDTEFAIKGLQQISEDVANGKIGLIYGVHATPLLFGFAASKVNDEATDWMSVPIPGPGKTSIPSPSSSISGVAINVNCEHPEAIVKIMNVANKYDTLMADAETKDYYVTDGHNFVIPLKYPHLPMSNLFMALQTKKMLEGKDIAQARDEAIEEFFPVEDQDILKEIYSNETENMIYNLVKPYIDEGTNDSYPWYIIFGPEGSEHILTYYWKNFDTTVVQDAYLGPITETMSEFTSTQQKMINETFTRIIMGEDDISVFDGFIDDINAIGGDDINREVNEWYNNNK